MRCLSQSFEPVGVGARLVAVDAVGPLHLGVGVFAIGRADDEARAHALDEGAEHPHS